MSRIEKAIATVADRAAREGSAYLYEREGMSNHTHHVIFVMSCRLYKLGFYTVVRGDQIEVKPDEDMFGPIDEDPIDLFGLQWE